MFSKEEIKEILDRLEIEYPDAECALDHENIYQLLVAVVLSAQTTDKSVNRISGKLFEAYPNPQALAEGDLAEIEQILRSIGMYRTKAKNIKALAKALVENYNGQVPEDYDQLINLPGVGRKTANVVLAVGFGHQRIAVDTHVFRVSNRIGLVCENNVLKTELALMKAIPEERWSRTHHSLIFHGRNCCDARKPNCQQCCINNYCQYYKASK